MADMFKECTKCKTSYPIDMFTSNRGITISCIKCRQRYNCEHGRRKDRCIEGICHGSQICEHGRQKYQCKEGNCRGSQICEHGRLKFQCIEGNCYGSRICKHRRQKSRCKEGNCRGSQICEHGRRKSRCKEGNCRGSQICERERVESAFSKCAFNPLVVDKIIHLECHRSRVCKHHRQIGHCVRCTLLSDAASV